MSGDKIDFSNIELSEMLNIEGMIETAEMYIDYIKVKQYFKELLKDNLIYERVIDHRLLTREYDLILNCTNNYIKNNTVDSYYELTITLVYQKIGITEFGALTLIDGNFFSIYPYTDDSYTVTDVQFTPLYRGDILQDVLNRADMLTDRKIHATRRHIEKKIQGIYPSFLQNFKYKSYFTAIKSKTYSTSADRYPIVTVDDKTINCFTGKIQGIYKITEEIKKYIYENTNR
jgi:hypothetical protein